MNPDDIARHRLASARRCEAPGCATYGDGPDGTLGLTAVPLADAPRIGSDYLVLCAPHADARKADADLAAAHPEQPRLW